MITEVATFLKPCAFGAPQAASGFDQRRHLGEGVAVSSMPHCGVRQGRQISALTRGASYTAIAWGVGLSHERLDIAGADGFHSPEGNMWSVALLSPSATQ
jgi:hypothetical protein